MKASNFFHGLITKPFKSPFGKGSQQLEEEDLKTIAANEQKQLTFESLVSATRDFHPKRKLGEGGFGPVFKGKLEDGVEVAVKRLSRSSIIGKKEFKEEARLLTRVQHKNVVNLLGFCADGAEKLLVYEYVANESLDKHLFEESDNLKKGVLDWKKRYDIIVGVARGLQYLHEDSPSCIIHRHISASNILLDDKWAPKITDFGMTKLFPEDQTGVNTRVAGTNRYMAPEYAMHGQLSTKVDVFSYGVVVLELIIGRKNSTFNGNAEAQNLLEWAWKLYKKGLGHEIIDPGLASATGFNTEQVSFCIQMGLLCTQADPKPRPSMRQVTLMLSKKPATLDEPMRPGHPGSRYRRPRKREGTGMSTSNESNADGDHPSTSSSSSHGKQPMES